jgi:hypothetical protein
MVEKFEVYDLLGIVVPGTLLVGLTLILFPALSTPAINVKLPDGFTVICLVALSVFAGNLVQAISSLVEPLVEKTWGGRMSEKGLSQGFGDRYLPTDSAARIRNKLASVLASDAVDRSLFLFAMQKAETSGNPRVGRFNALYAYHRAILTLMLMAVLLLALSMVCGLAVQWSPYQKTLAIGGAILLFLITWNRTRQRAVYYVREVLLTAERVIETNPGLQNSVDGKNSP